MQNRNTDIVWDRIRNNSGEIFTQIRGKEFSYSVSGNIAYLSTTNRSFTKNVIGDALEYVPLENTTQVQHLQAPSYLYAILMDDRIRYDLW